MFLLKLCVAISNGFIKPNEDQGVSVHWAISKRASKFLLVTHGDYMLDSNLNNSDCRIQLAEYYIDIARDKLNDLNNVLKEISFANIDIDDDFMTPQTTISIEGDDKYIYNTTELRELHDRKQQILKILTEEEALGNELEFKKLSKQVNKRTAATCFYSLLQLHQEGQIKLKQENDIVIELKQSFQETR